MSKYFVNGNDKKTKWELNSNDIKNNSVTLVPCKNEMK